MLKLNRNRPRMRWLPTFAVSAAMLWGSGLANPQPAAAQDEYTTTTGEEAGDKTPVYGYVVTSLFVGLAMFIVCKSARR